MLTYFNFLGLVTLKEDLAADTRHKTLLNLCKLENGVLKVLCYPAAEPLSLFIDKFDIMIKKSPVLFLHFLNKRIEKLENCRLALEDIESEIWLPVFKECQTLVKWLSDQSIKLSYIDDHLKSYSKNLETVVDNLIAGLSECLGEKMDTELVAESQEKIREYWKLCEYQTGAKEFLRLKEVIGLKDDFEVVRRFSSEVNKMKQVHVGMERNTVLLFLIQLSKSMGEKELKDVDCNLADTGDFLKNIFDVALRGKALKAFSDCRGIVEWLQHFTKS